VLFAQYGKSFVRVKISQIRRIHKRTKICNNEADIYVSRYEHFQIDDISHKTLTKYRSLHITYSSMSYASRTQKPYLQDHDYNIGRDPGTNTRARTKDIYVLWEHKTLATEDAYIKMWGRSSKPVPWETLDTLMYCTKENILKFHTEWAISSNHRTVPGNKTRRNDNRNLFFSSCVVRR
jgi:hypothetical protein